MEAPMISAPSSQEFSSSTLVVVVADLTGYAIAFRTRSDADMVRLLDRYYRVAEDPRSSSSLLERVHS
jgi:class 3 adenylate cyclase